MKCSISNITSHNKYKYFSDKNNKLLPTHSYCNKNQTECESMCILQWKP